jgi:ABC-type nitrate/sulfonate/bicarbonate transport system substrate-binding protein
MTLAAALKSLGLTTNDIKSVNMDVTSALTAFKGGQSDGLAVWNAIAFSAEDAGFVRVADAGTLGVTSTCGLMATNDALQNKRELLKKAWEVYYLTWQWCNESPENMEKAVKYYVESCENEGVVSNEDISRRALKIFKAPSVKDAISVMTDTEADKKNLYTSRKLLKGENDLLQTLDFFIEQGKYTAADRNKLLDNKLVDSSIAAEAKADLESLGVKIK